MSATVFVEKEKADHLRLVNDTGANMVQGEFGVVSGLAAIADEDVVSGATGSYHIAEGIVVQAATFATSEDTFATGGAPVYWDPSAKKFSDTKKATYYEVGKVVEIKSSAGSGAVIRFAKLFRAILVPLFSALADVDAAAPTNNDTLKFVTSTAKWTVVAVTD